MLRDIFHTPVGFVGGFIVGYTFGLEKSIYTPFIPLTGLMLTHRHCMLPWFGFSVGMIVGLIHSLELKNSSPEIRLTNGY